MTLSLEAVVSERRKFPRRAVSQRVKLEIDDAATHHALLVTDISQGGARLFAHDAELPDEFVLVFLDSNVRRTCRVIWRVGPEAGLKFVGPSNGRANGKRR